MAPGHGAVHAQALITPATAVVSLLSALLRLGSDHRTHRRTHTARASLSLRHCSVSRAGRLVGVVSRSCETSRHQTNARHTRRSARVCAHSAQGKCPDLSCLWHHCDAPLLSLASSSIRLAIVADRSTFMVACPCGEMGKWTRFLGLCRAAPRRTIGPADQGYLLHPYSERTAAENAIRIVRATLA